MRKSLIDSYNREIDYLRISINHECNYNCVYCDKEGYEGKNGDSRLSPIDVEKIVKLFDDIGDIKRVKITGGEPLLHPGILEIIRRVSSVPGIRDVSLTTNAFLLKDMAKSLREAGLNRVNISLCSLNRETFKKITRVDGLDTVLQAIDEALAQGLAPIKINYVLIKGINDGELNDLLNFCAKKDLRLQLIELHEIAKIHEKKHEFFKKHYLNANEALEKITIPVEKIEYRGLQKRKIIFYENGSSIEVIKMSPSFCEKCSKLRITADGEIKPCLMQPDQKVNILKHIKEGSPLEELKTIIHQTVNTRKPYIC